jgi:hypothetical protein
MLQRFQPHGREPIEREIWLGGRNEWSAGPQTMLRIFCGTLKLSQNMSSHATSAIGGTLNEMDVK